jgi:CDP-glycerol glycerophosphotransferase
LAEVVTLSVVVPFHNVERYIEASLESIARQTHRDIQVIMVDDGSVDGSTLIAKNFAARDPRFELLQQHNQGLGPARNSGAAHATGKYLAFADSDDLLDPHAYELLTGSLERTGSDMAAGGVTRFGPLGPTQSWLHEEPFRTTIQRTHVSQFPVLLQDRTAWNKVFRRTFWDQHQFKFPAGLYEDGPVVLRAHVLASSVDIFRDVVYYWRVRDSGDLSITQRAREPRNIEQRMASVGSVAGFLATNAPTLKPAYDRSVLKGDIAMLVSACELATDEERERLASLAADYLGSVDDSAYRGVPAINRLHCYLLAHGMLPELLEVLRFSRRGDALDAQLVRVGGHRARWYAAYPFFQDPARAIPDEIYDVTSEMTLQASVDAVTWRGGKLRVEGAAYIRQLSSATPAECQIRVTLRNIRTRRSIKAPVERVYRPDITVRSGQGAVSYDWSGFAVEIDPHQLATLPGVWRAANWELMVQVSGAGIRRKGPITSVRPGSAQWPDGHWVVPGVWVQPAPEHDGRFVIRGQRVTAFAASCQATGTTIDLEGWTSFPLSPGAELLIAPRKGGVKTIRVPAEISAPQGEHAGRSIFRAHVPVGKLISPKGGATPLDRTAPAHDEFTWDVSISAGPGIAATRLAASSTLTGTRGGSGGREVTAFVTHFGYLSLLERAARPVVTNVQWTAEQHLVLRGSYPDRENLPTELILRHSRSGEQYTVPLTWAAGMFTAELDPSAMPSQAATLPLVTGSWQLLASTGAAEMIVAVDRQLLTALPGYHRSGLHEVEAQPYRTDALRLSVRTAQSDGERGRHAQRQLRTHDYRRAAGEPLRDLAVFDSFGGRQYSCNPRAIYEELRRSHPELDCAWVTEEGEFTVPHGDRTVLTGTREHYTALAQARYVIFNDTLPPWFRKRDGQTCLQTWHGTPLKRIGLDVDRPKFASGLIYPDLLRADVAHWDLLLSPNAFSTPLFRRAFGFDGEIMECGYPRNDALHRPGQAKRAAAIRASLGLPAGKRVVLYAPTWRDDADRDQGIYRFDLQLDLDAAAAALGDDHVLLVRLHTKAQCNLPRTGVFVTDVTHFPDITDLYLISDVLVTDYSSVMFDFAGTGRPMVFFTYDLERYRDTLRGFYFDFEDEAPGPLLATTGEVIDALRGIDGVARAHREAYDAFAGKYCALDDGQAAARAVERLLKDGYQ